MYWQTQDFSKIKTAPQSFTLRALTVVLACGMLLQILLGALIVYFAVRYHFMGSWTFGAALLISYPLVWAHLLVFAGIFNVVTWKRYGKAALCAVLERQVEALRRRHQFIVVAVAGSVGKTSTKLAIAKLLASQKRVIYQDGNYNDRLTVPLVLFGQTEPALFNIFAWVKLLQRNRRMIAGEYPYDIAVLELGSDGPGQIERFRYLHPDIAVITAVAPEHMEYFGDMDAVAREELCITQFSDQILLNTDDISANYVEQVPAYKAYGTGETADYRVKIRKNNGLRGASVRVNVRGKPEAAAHISYIGAHGAKVFLAAYAVADILGLQADDIKQAAKALQPSPGRMQVLTGKHDSTLIDDTYNASPVAVKAALDALYAAKATKRIAVLGSMNELGDSSRAAHEAIGNYCDPKKIDLLITLGSQANEYLAPVAEAKGCQTEKYMSPYDVGMRLEKELAKGVVVLLKGSQNRVFAEEAIKPLLEHPSDEAKLVRQSKAWLAVKQKQFSA